MLRFAKELHDVGVSEDLKKLIEAEYARAPNVVSVEQQEIAKRFLYQHGRCKIEAKQVVSIVVRKSI
jgi:hypothetical protein